MTINNRFWRVVAVCAAAALLLARAADAQLAVATLAGRVNDPQSRPAPGATVSVRNVGTGATWTSVSGSDGRFSVPMLPPGIYTADVQLTGFAPWRADGIALRVGQEQVLTVQLRVGSVRETVSATIGRKISGTVSPLGR